MSFIWLWELDSEQHCASGKNWELALGKCIMQFCASLYTLYLFCEKGPWPIFCLLCFPVFLFSVYVLLSPFFPSLLSVTDPIPLYVQSDVPINQTMLNSPQIHSFVLSHSVCHRRPCATSVCLPSPQTKYHHIWLKVTPAVSKARVRRRPSTQVAFCWQWFLVFFYSRMSLILRDMIPTCFYVLWLSLHFFSPLQILGCKMRRRESCGSLPCHDFLFSFGGK